MAAATLDPRVFRSVMSHWATGVSVITSLGPAGPAGCTANAVTSVSLDPLEMLVCFDRASDTLQAVTTSGRLAVNVLTTDQEHLSARFARKGSPEIKFADVGYDFLEGVPVLADTLATIVCDVDRMLAGGDHEIVIGHPITCTMRPEAEPLIFFRNAYTRATPVRDAVPTLRG
jgi:3-hydroxy-9,10-secoandrosta-1,3,5(10)-triene-9,17-dione monooxygenase reductase component